MVDRRKAGAIVLFATLAAACAKPTVVPIEQPATAPLPEAFYQEAIARGEPVLAIDSAQSQAVVHVYRGGSLARFGHNHVVASRDLHGYVLLRNSNPQQADLYLPLASLTVDEPALRAEAGFDSTPSQNDIDGTRRNMLDKVLEADRYPYLSFHVTPNDDRTLNAEITLHGVTRTLQIPVEIETTTGHLRVSGHFSVNQTDFGITPFSAVGGALKVQDRIDLQFVVYARRP
ncbi:MAG: YceI family protein [Gammaproteobacteria bacterium]|nr:YceI family protein [Gammaproteobacteria bacterium]